MSTLYLIPVGLGDSVTAETYLPSVVLETIQTLDYFIVENAKTARKFLKILGYNRPIQDVKFQLLNEHTTEKEVESLLAPLREGHDVGVMSEAGCPAVADPGSLVVARAHASGIRVVPFVGPSSILLALMASGLSGQHFEFHGYLPIGTEDRKQKLLYLSKTAKTQKMTHLFIETPYRNQKLFELIIKTCPPDRKLCIACDITLPTEWIQTHSIETWQKRENIPDLGKRPAIFLLG